MPNLIRTVKAYSDGSIEVTSTTPPAVTGWRVLHWVESGDPKRGRPEVVQLEPEVRTPFGEAWQWLSFHLNTTANPLITASINKTQWRAVHADGTNIGAFHNSMGFEGAEPVHDWVNEMDANSPDPGWHRPLVCGGAFLHGIVNGDYLEVESMTESDGAPSLEWLLDRPWLYYDAVICGETGIPRRFPQGTDGNRVFVPLVTSVPVRIPLAKLQRWEADALPDPYLVYV